MEDKTVYYNNSCADKHANEMLALLKIVCFLVVESPSKGKWNKAKAGYHQTWAEKTQRREEIGGELKILPNQMGV